MGFLSDLVDKLPGSHIKNPLMGGKTMSEFVDSTTTGSLSDNGLAAINALDPTIQVERMVNGVYKGLGGSENIVSENTMAEQANVLNTVGKIIAANWVGGQVGGATGSELAQNAASGAASAGMNNQNIAEGAVVSGITGAFTPTTDTTVVSQPTITEMALRRAGQGAAVAAAKGGSGNEILTSAGAGVISGGMSDFNPIIQGVINGAINSGIQADKAGQPIENGLFYGALTGGASAAAGDAAYDYAGGKNNKAIADLAGTIAGKAAGYAAGKYAQDNLPSEINLPVDLEFEKYMKYLHRGYSPQIQEVINPMILAAVGNGPDAEVNPTQLTQSTGISPLLQGA